MTIMNKRIAQLLISTLILLTTVLFSVAFLFFDYNAIINFVLLAIVVFVSSLLILFIIVFIREFLGIVFISLLIIVVSRIPVSDLISVGIVVVAVSLLVLFAREIIEMFLWAAKSAAYALPFMMFGVLAVSISVNSAFWASLFVIFLISVVVGFMKAYRFYKKKTRFVKLRPEFYKRYKNLIKKTGVISLTFILLVILFLLPSSIYRVSFALVLVILAVATLKFRDVFMKIVSQILKVLGEINAFIFKVSEVAVRATLKFSPFIVTGVILFTPPVITIFRSLMLLRNRSFVFTPAEGFVPASVVSEDSVYIDIRKFKSKNMPVLAHAIYAANIGRAVSIGDSIVSGGVSKIKKGGIYVIFEEAKEVYPPDTFSTPAPATPPDTFCFFSIGRKYDIDPYLLKAISIVESGMDSGAKNINSNGTTDYGHMQINTIWVEELGLDTNRLVSDPCYCTEAAAQILSRLFAQYGRHWETVGRYHSFKSSKRNEYYWKVREVYVKIKNQKRKEVDDGK